MKKHLTILAGVAALAMIAGQALAQSCQADPNDRCTIRFADDPNDWIAKLYPGAGGSVSCDGIPASTVQYDSYLWQNNGFVYQCSVDLACSVVQASDPQAYAKFCP